MKGTVISHKKEGRTVPGLTVMSLSNIIEDPGAFCFRVGCPQHHGFVPSWVRDGSSSSRPVPSHKHLRTREGPSPLYDPFLRSSGTCSESSSGCCPPPRLSPPPSSSSWSHWLDLHRLPSPKPVTSKGTMIPITGTS